MYVVVGCFAENITCWIYSSGWRRWRTEGGSSEARYFPRSSVSALEGINFIIMTRTVSLRRMLCVISFWFLPPLSHTFTFLAHSSELQQCLLNQEKEKLGWTDLLLFLLCPEGLAEQRNFSSCLEGDYKVVSSLFSLPPASWMVIIVLPRYWAFLLQLEKRCVIGRNTSTVLLAWALPNRNSAGFQDIGTRVFLCTLYSGLTASYETCLDVMNVLKFSTNYFFCILNLPFSKLM